MPERDPYDFSALAPDFSALEESELELTASPAAINHPALDVLDDDDFEAEMERLASEEQGLALQPAMVDAEFRALQRALADLSQNLVDPDLEAEEAWLEALMNEESESAEPPWAAPA